MKRFVAIRKRFSQIYYKAFLPQYETKVVPKGFSLRLEKIDAEPVCIEGYLVNALVTFANIWLAIDVVFMLPEMLNYKHFFYEENTSLSA